MENQESITFRPEYSGMKAGLMSSLFLIILGAVVYYIDKPIEWSLYVKDPRIYSWIAIFLVAIGLLRLFKIKITIASNKYILTPQRLTAERGFLAKKVSNLELWRIVDIELKQSASEAATGGCKIVLTTQDLSDPTMYIKGLNIKHGREIYNILTEYIANNTKTSGVMRTV